MDDNDAEFSLLSWECGHPAWLSKPKSSSVVLPWRHSACAPTNNTCDAKRQEGLRCFHPPGHSGKRQSHNRPAWLAINMIPPYEKVKRSQGALPMHDPPLKLDGHVLLNCLVSPDLQTSKATRCSLDQSEYSSQPKKQTRKMWSDMTSLVSISAPMLLEASPIDHQSSRIFGGTLGDAFQTVVGALSKSTRFNPVSERQTHTFVGLDCLRWSMQIATSLGLAV